MVSIIPKELEYKVEKLKYKKFKVMQPRIRIKFELPLVNKPSRIRLHKVVQSWLINTIYHLSVKVN